MIILDNVTVGDAFPNDVQSGGAQMYPAIKSNGGYFNIQNNQVYLQLAYAIEPSDYGQGQTAWTKAVPFPIGPGILSPGTIGVRFKNYVAGQAAIVSGSLSENAEPPIIVTSSGNATATAPLVPVVLSLPGSPTNQQQIILVDSLVAPNYAWLLQFDSGLTTPGWLFIGGSKIRSANATLTLPRAGSYDVLLTARVSTSAASPATGGLSITASSGSITGVTQVDNNWSSSTGQTITMTDNGAAGFRLTGAAVGATVTIAATGSGSSPNYAIEATPVIITG